MSVKDWPVSLAHLASQRLLAQVRWITLDLAPIFEFSVFQDCVIHKVTAAFLLISTRLERRSRRPVDHATLPIAQSRTVLNFGHKRKLIEIIKKKESYLTVLPLTDLCDQLLMRDEQYVDPKDNHKLTDYPRIINRLFRWCWHVWPWIYKRWSCICQWLQKW